MDTQMGIGRTKSTRRLVIGCICWLLFSTFGGGISVAGSQKELHVVAFGDSLTAGYNLPQGADFARQLEIGLRERGHKVRVSNAGVSGDTTTGGLTRFDWAVPADTDVVVLELGANDALRGVDPKIARKNLGAILAKLKARNIPVLLAGMRAPANWGDDYVRAFNAIYPDLAARFGAELYPFFMEGVINKPALKLKDALHPNADGVKEIVRRILPVAENVIEKARAR